MIKEKKFISRIVAKIGLCSRPRKGMFFESKVFSQGRKLLLCLPDGLPSEEIADYLADTLKPSRLFLLTDKKVTSSKFEIFQASDYVGLSGLPKGELIDRLKSEKIDLAIDLHLNFCLFTAYLCAKSEARLTASFRNSEADSFFNLEYEPKNPDRPEAELCKDFIDLLGEMASRPSR